MIRVITVTLYCIHNNNKQRCRNLHNLITILCIFNKYILELNVHLLWKFGLLLLNRFLLQIIAVNKFRRCLKLTRGKNILYDMGS